MGKRRAGTGMDMNNIIVDAISRRNALQRKEGEEGDAVLEEVEAAFEDGLRDEEQVVRGVVVRREEEREDERVAFLTDLSIFSITSLSFSSSTSLSLSISLSTFFGVDFLPLLLALVVVCFAFIFILLFFPLNFRRDGDFSDAPFLELDLVNRLVVEGIVIYNVEVQKCEALSFGNKGRPT